MKKNRSRWWLAGGLVAGIAATCAGLAFLVKKAFAPDLDDESLFDAPPTPAVETFGAATHASTGSGAGWPEPPLTPEHTEVETAVLPSIPGGAAAAGAPIREANAEAPALPVTAAPAPSQPFAPPPAPPAAPIAAAEPPAPVSTIEVPEPPARESAVEVPEQADDAEDDMLDRTVAMPPGQLHAGLQESGPVAGSDPVSPEDALPAVPSDPPVRPETPFTEQQAEMNLRLQEHQEELLNAFPGLSVHDLVASDGEIERLADSLVPKSGMERGAVIERLQAILRVGASDATNPGALDVPVTQPDSPEYVQRDPEKHV